MNTLYDPLFDYVCDNQEYYHILITNYACLCIHRVAQFC
jgi:hypothetical protein